MATADGADYAARGRFGGMTMLNVSLDEWNAMMKSPNKGTPRGAMVADEVRALIHRLHSLDPETVASIGINILLTDGTSINRNVSVFDGADEGGKKSAAGIVAPAIGQWVRFVEKAEPEAGMLSSVIELPAQIRDIYDDETVLLMVFSDKPTLHARVQYDPCGQPETWHYTR